MTPVTGKKRKLVIPGFASPGAEAAWFDKNRKKLEADMSRRRRAGDTVTLPQALARSAAAEKARLKPVTIRMLPDDLEAARLLAAAKGRPYQTYIKMLLREALRREMRKPAQAADCLPSTLPSRPLSFV